MRYATDGSVMWSNCVDSSTARLNITISMYIRCVVSESVHKGKYHPITGHRGPGGGVDV
jgi:hypothetical protein